MVVKEISYSQGRLYYRGGGGNAFDNAVSANQYVGEAGGEEGG